ncbi:unnamed protein product, partial [Anisakis simplex]|uniref:VWFA domain-containing protein n=1 Tax=Anisakis simplex TaxID=6269 RepID=A0A0M3K3G9_ANISI
KPVYPVVDADGRPLPTDETGVVVGPDGEPIPTDSAGRPVDADGSPLPTDAYGRVISVGGTDTMKTLPTYETGVVVGPDGEPMQTDQSGRPVEVYGSVTSAPKILPTDEAGRIIRPIVGPDGKPLPTDQSGAPIGAFGKPVPRDRYGRPVGPDRRVLPTDDVGNYVYPAIGPDGQPLPTDAAGRSVYPVVHPDGYLLPTAGSGAVVGPDGKPLPTDESGKPVSADGSIFPTDSSGRFLLIPEDEGVLTIGPDGEPMSTSHAADRVGVTSPYFVIMPDGNPLPTDFSNNYIDEDGEKLNHDQYGRPVDRRGRPLSKDANGNYIYPVIVQKRPVTQKPVFDLINSYGHPLPTDSNGNFLNERGRPIPTDSSGYPANDSQHIFEKNAHGQFVYKPRDLLRELLPVTVDSFTTMKKSPYCTVNSNADVLLLLDASANVRVVDYRIMKEFIENFLIDHFNLRKNRARIGVIKYGDKVELPIALGDYDNPAQLMTKISDTRRMRGSAHLGAALRDAASEFLISGTTATSKVVIVFSNGKSSDDPAGNARVLREDVGALVFLVDAGGQGDPQQNIAVVGESNPQRIISLEEWRGSDSELVAPFADQLCEADVMFVMDSSENFTPEQYTQLKEGLSTLIDESFDLSPDVVQVGFVEYRFKPDFAIQDELNCDKASVPVALGHYEDKVQLLTDIANSEQLLGEAIMLKGLNAARQQFLQHGRENVPRILLLITNGVNRGNAASAADDLRDRYNVELFILAVNASGDGIKMLNRLAGESANQKVISLGSADKLHGPELAYIGRTLCGFVEPAAATIKPVFTELPDSHKTTKRDVSKAIEIGKTLSYNPGNESILVIHCRMMWKDVFFQLVGKRKKFVDWAPEWDAIFEELVELYTSSEAIYYIDEEQTSVSPVQTPYRTTQVFGQTPLCKDGFLRPYQMTVVVDSTARSTQKDLNLVLAHIMNFVETRFSPESGRMQLNLVTVDSSGVTLREPNFGVDSIHEKFSLIKQTEGDELSAKLGRGIDEAVMLSTQFAISGVNEIILLVSADGTSRFGIPDSGTRWSLNTFEVSKDSDHTPYHPIGSQPRGSANIASDDAIASADFARTRYHPSIIAISIRTPANELLKELAGGSPTRVIHFSEWSIGNELFGSWLAHAICDYVTASTTKKMDISHVTPPHSKRTTLTTETGLFPVKPPVSEPTNIEVVPLSPNSFSVSWTCCTNNKAEYVILHTPDSSLPKWQWLQIPAKCRDSFGKKIDNLPTDTSYTVCVETQQTAANRTAPLNLNNCDSVHLNKDTTAPPDYEPIDEVTSPCQCLCTGRGDAVIQPSCGQSIQQFRPLSTLPPATEGECPCKMPSHSGRCPTGYYLNGAMCYDTNECQQQNGGCSHGCVNTPGDFYCACPHGMMRDPVNPKQCINVAASFDRIAELIGRYLGVNAQHMQSTQPAVAVASGEPIHYKTNCETGWTRVSYFLRVQSAG